jgi:AraC family transcriptional regulator
MSMRAKPGDPEIGHLWGKFGPRMGEFKHAVGRDAAYGAMDHFDEQMTGFDYLAAVEVKSDKDLPAGMVVWEIPAQTYVVYGCTIPTIMQVYDNLYGSWLQSAGYQRASGPEFEYYPAEFNPDDPNSRLDIYVPVEKAS